MPACRRLASIAFQPVLMLYPPQKGRVSHAAAPFSQPSHPVSKTQLKAQIPTNTQDHDFLVDAPTFEQFLDWYESRHLSIIPELLVRLHQSPLDTAGLQRVGPVAGRKSRCAIYS